MLITFQDKHANLARDIFGALDKHWTGTDNGMLRPGFSREESEAFNIVTGFACNLGYDVYDDAVGNRIFLKPGANPALPVHMGGSHLDAVPRGGRYDGPAGVVARLLAGSIISENNGGRLQAGYGCIAFRNEESPWFGDYAVGSKLATAQLGPEFLQKIRKDTKQTLFSHMTDLGIDAHGLSLKLSEKQAVLPVEYIGSFVETHIEQGPLLMRAGCDVGIVNGIRGNVRFTGDAAIVFHGQAGHSGAVPQGDRADAVVMGAHFIQQVSRAVREFNEDKRDAVVSFPVAHTKDGASQTTIADYFRVMAEVRSTQEDVLEHAESVMKLAAKQAADDNHGRVDLPKAIRNRPAVMDRSLVENFERMAMHTPIRTMTMASGAGHDCAIMAWAGVPSAMLFVMHGNNGISHDPSEIMSIGDKDDPVGVGSSFAHAVTLDAMHIQRACAQKPSPAQRGEGFVQALLARGGMVVR